MMRNHVLALVLAASMSMPSAAFAQRKRPRGAAPTAPAPTPAPAPAPAPVSLADSLSSDAKADYESGRLLFQDSDFAGALVKFEGAFEKSKDVRLLWNMAACEKNLRHYARVLSLVRRYLAEGGDKLTEQDKLEASELLKNIEPLTSSLRFRVDVDGAEVTVDDVAVGTTPIEQGVVVDIGMRRVRIAKPEHKDFVAQVPVGGSPELVVEAKLEKIVHEGQLSIVAARGDAIYVDGKLVGTGRWLGTVKSGGHQIRVTAAERRPFQSEVLVQDQQTRTVQVLLEREAEPRSAVPAWVWVAGGAVVAGAAVGAYFIFKPSEEPAETPAGNLSPGSVQASVRFR